MLNRTLAFRASVWSKGDHEVEAVRREVDQRNAENTDRRYRYRISFKGRLGPANRYRDIYRRRTCYSVLHEHAAYFDVYVHRVYVG